MNDRELTTMAVFRLREAARRLVELGSLAESPALGMWMQGVAQKLDAQARRAASIAAHAEEPERTPALRSVPSAAAAREGSSTRGSISQPARAAARP
jgi:hypothetical protein